MPALLRTTQIQEPSSASVNLTLDTSGNGTFAGTSVMSSPYTMRNKIINGAMVIDQRNSGASVNPSTGVYTLDRWFGGGVHDGVLAVQKVSDAPTGFSNSLRVTVSTADSSLGATQYARMGQLIEGYNIVDFSAGTASAATITLSFWVKSSLTGTFGGSLTNGDETRVYVFQYTINSANTWEQKSVTATLATSGTWATDNTTGMRLFFSLGAGSSLTNTANTWLTSYAQQASGNVNVLNTLNATWQVTGVQLERGTVATPFEYRNYQQELAMCQRYTQVLGGNFAGNVESSSSLSIIEKFVVEMRAVPTCSVRSGTAAAFRYGAGDVVINSPSLSAATSSTTGLWTLVTGGSGYSTVPFPIMARNPALNFILASAEL